MSTYLLVVSGHYYIMASSNNNITKADETSSDDKISSDSSFGQQMDIPLVFIRENELFGQRKPSKEEFVKHSELYEAIGRKIEPTHITGLQRIRGMWRVYLDNIDDKVALMAEGVTLRGKRLTVLPTNPIRFDGERTIRVRVQNIPLSVDDGIIERTLILQNLTIISQYREKLRINGKLTNCATGDRIFIVKESTLKTPLPQYMQFGHFTGRVFHFGQNIKPKKLQCTKCLQDGHNFAECPNDWICLLCKQTGHKQSDCNTADTASEDKSDTDDETDSESTQCSQPVPPTNQGIPASKSEVPVSEYPVQSQNLRPNVIKSSQQSIDKYVTPIRGKSSCATERSPPTPVEELHNRTLSDQKAKKTKKKK